MKFSSNGNPRKIDYRQLVALMTCVFVVAKNEEPHFYAESYYIFLCFYIFSTTIYLNRYKIDFIKLICA